MNLFYSGNYEIGTPGTGKSTFSSLLQASLGSQFEVVDVSEFTKVRGFYEEFDEDRQCYVLDEDKLLDELETMVAGGFRIIDYHSSELFPERWFDLVVVLRTDNSILYSRLQARGYPEKKIQENVECEIMQVLLEEAMENYKPEIILELNSNSLADMEENVSVVQQFLQQRFQGAM